MYIRDIFGEYTAYYLLYKVIEISLNLNMNKVCDMYNLYLSW
jgi:hypothetical protein